MTAPLHHAIYAFRDLPLDWTTIHGKPFLFDARATGEAKITADEDEGFWLDELHVEATCPENGDRRLVIVTRQDQLFDPIERALRHFRQDAICKLLQMPDASPVSRVLKRALPDALADLGNAIHGRRAQAFRDSRLPYPKDEVEITRG